MDSGVTFVDQTGIILNESWYIYLTKPEPKNALPVCPLESCIYRILNVTQLAIRLCQPFTDEWNTAIFNPYRTKLNPIV
jgi:hypothetical protein